MVEKNIDCKRIDYIKPSILDLGSVAVATGGTTCNDDGGTATVNCTDGTGATLQCMGYGSDVGGGG